MPKGRFVVVCALAAAPIPCTPATAQSTTVIYAPDAAIGDRFGTAVALGAGVAAIAAPMDDTPAGAEAGSVWLYAPGDDGWAPVQQLVAPDAAERDYFGRSVSISGDLLAVGVPGDDVAGAIDAGSVHVFRRSGSVWSHVAHLTAPEPRAYDFFGYAVAISGGTLLVGAYGDDLPNAPDAGAVYAFALDGVEWSLTQRLVAGDPVPGHGFGIAVALAGSTGVIGAPYDDGAGITNAGAAYVFQRANGSWQQIRKLTPTGGGAGDIFGRAVAIGGGTIAVGAPRADVNGLSDAGLLHLYSMADGLTDAQVIQSSWLTDHAAFAGAVAMDGSRVLAGNLRSEHLPGPFPTPVSILEPVGGGWGETGLAFPADPGADGSYGAAVAVRGGVSLIGNWAGVSGTGHVMLTEGGASCRTDMNGDGQLTLSDFVAFRNAYTAGDMSADFDNSGDLTLSDFVAFRNAYTAGCSASGQGAQ